MAQCRLFRRVAVLMVIYVSRSSYETMRRLLTFHIGISTLHLVMVREAIEYTTHTSLVRIVGNLNADRCISDIIRSVVVPYLTDRPNAIYQQNNRRSHVALRVYRSYPIPRVFDWCPGLHGLQIWPTENVWSWVAEKLARHPFPVNMIDEVWHRLDAA